MCSNHNENIAFVCFQYPPTTLCIFRDRVWDNEMYSYEIDWIDIVEGMTEFPNSTRKDLIRTHFSVPHGLEKQEKQDNIIFLSSSHL